MSRVIHEAAADLVSEALAPVTEIQWNPATNEGQVVFRVERFTWLGERLLARTPERDVVVPLSEVLADTFEVATPDGVVLVPGALVAGAIKVAFDRYYLARSAAEADAVDAAPVEDPALAPPAEEPAP